MALVHGNKQIVISGLGPYLDAGNPRSYNINDPRENFVSYSIYGAPGQNTWANFFPAGATITTGIDAPDGSNNAVRFSGTNTTNALLRVFFPTVYPNGTDAYTVSFYVRKISGSGNAFADLQDGFSTNYSSQLITNQWVRVVITATPTSPFNFTDLLSDLTTNYVLDFWGVQLEKKSTVGDYIETIGSVILRGTIWTDLSPNKRIGSLKNGPTYSSSNGGFFSFDGTNDFASCPSGSSSVTNITMMGFVNVTLNTKGAFFANGGAPNGYSIGIGSGTYGTNGNDVIILFSGVRWATSTTDYTAGWQMVTMILDGSGVPSAYINTTPVTGLTGGSMATTPNPADLYIGSIPGGGNVAQCSVSNCLFYNRALTATEVAQNYNALKGRYGLS
jgi:hypothetical protein